eukprot:s8678_g1.t1
MSSNSQGYQMKLIAPVRGIGPGTWGVDFVNAAIEVGRPLIKICRGEPLLPALDVNGDFQMHAMKSSNLVRWVHSVLKGDVFTGHSAKATLLSWLAKWGGTSDSFERAEPLSSSEWVVPSGDHLDEDRLPLDGAWDEGPPAPAGAGVTDNEGRSSSESSASDSDSSDSSSDSGSSCDANLQLAGEHRSSVSPKVEGDCVLYQHSKTRTATSDHKVFMSIVYTPNMRCKQCLNGRPLRDVGALNEALQSALKRQRSAGK